MLWLSLFLNAYQLFQPAPQIHKGPEILWDTWGVPHIVARKDTDAFYAFGWAQMPSHGDLLLKLYAVARGRGERLATKRQWCALVHDGPFSRQNALFA